MQNRLAHLAIISETYIVHVVILLDCQIAIGLIRLQSYSRDIILAYR
jgi:hypothetical protein